jgi:glycerophosphoryl diester phosphodiesterase
VTTTSSGRSGSGEGGACPLLVARAGAPTVAPEHTIPAYEAAILAGADALLVDVHLSADDQLVVIRDGRLERTTDGRGRVRERTLPELKRLDAGRWFGRAFRGQRIQTASASARPSRLGSPAAPTSTPASRSGSSASCRSTR